MFHQIMRVIVFEFKVASLDYFLDEMQEYEISMIFDNLKYLDRNSWEQTRFQIYANAQMNTRKHLKETDIMKLPWDNGDTDGETEITTVDVNRLQEKSQRIIQSLNRNNGK